MSRPGDLRRLLDGDDDASGLVERALRAERADTVDRARLERIGLGIGAATAVSAAPAPPAHAKPASFVGSKGALSLFAAAAAGGFAALLVTSSETPPAPSSAAPPPAAIVATEPPASEAAEPPTVSPSDLPSEPLVGPSGPAKAKAAASAGGAPKATDDDEIALLARAHDALGADPARALALCREHEARFSVGHFAQEREAVAIEALVYLGRADEARRRLLEFRRRHPTSSHRVHLESLLPEAKSTR